MPQGVTPDNRTKMDAIRLFAQGKSLADVADQVGLAVNTVHRMKKKNLEIIQKETERFLESIPDITERMIRDLWTYNKISKVLAGEENKETLPPTLTFAINK